MASKQMGRQRDNSDRATEAHPEPYEGLSPTKVDGPTQGLLAAVESSTGMGLGPDVDGPVQDHIDIAIIEIDKSTDDQDAHKATAQA
ncbi:hypothetical protein E2562_020712 [Oryza meyeriana var. granulata]|uniref:Uncharacterized protein n=1 Tax=Oryza meyeriana var. granulata TaxID=110450 RepID=A0A6G1EN20_9ORYZ|nr:hypothetical protein E2562_020712 [Oryza meyeriana var. granulata]